MRISTKGRYSLEALLYMALLPEGSSASTRSIADHINISDGYLEQLFMPLRRAGILEGIRGSQGGYLLGTSIKDITVGEVLRIMEGTLQPTECVAANAVCPIKDSCEARHTWSKLYAEITDCVDSISLYDLREAYKDMDKIEYTI